MGAPTSVADLLELVRQSLPLDLAKLDRHVADLRKTAVPPNKPEELAALLVRDGFLTPFQADHLMRGRRPKFLIGKYLILDRLGAGGMGAVYLCEHLQMERQVALKVLPADQARDPASLARFHREAQAVAALNHPNIVRAYDVDMEGRTYFLVMEYVDGVDLQELASRRGWLDATRAAHYIRQAAEGLQHAHQARLVHRDVKPANLVLSRTGVVKVLDLGLARFFHEGVESLTKQYSSQAILGTADYLAPEQARDSHEVDIRADIYGLGATFYFLLAGRPPFADGTLNQKLLWHQMKTPAPVRKLRPETPEAMAAVVSRMMAKDPAGRYQTPADVAAALAPWTQSPLPPPLPADFPPPRRTAHAGRPWRKNMPATDSTVVQRATAVTAVLAPTTAANVPSAPPAAILNMELPTPPPRAVPIAKPLPVAKPPPAAPSPAAPAPVQTPAEDDWSRFFDDDSDARKRPGSFSRSSISKPLDLSVRKYGWYLVGAIPALILLVGGVCWVAFVGPAPPKPTAPSPGYLGAALPEPPRGPVHLRAAAKGPDAIELTWEDPNGPSTGFHIERAADRWFTKNLIGTNVAGGDLRSFTDAKVAPGVAYYYRMRALRASGESGLSNSAWPPPDYAQGFTPNGMVLNGGTAVVEKALRLTDLNVNEARSAFYQSEMDIRAFTTKFRFRISPGPMTAEGFTFCIQDGEPTRVGEAAAGLGYQGVARSVAVKFDLWPNDGEGANSTGLFRNGQKPSNPGAIDLGPSGIDLHSGRTYDAALDYKDNKLTLSITDIADPAKKFATTFTVDIPATVRGSTACVGFTGGTGGMGAVQEVLSWSWTSTEAGE
jgi:serine/threonine protein kinase